MTPLAPLTLYIHVPWCVQKCPYCDFNSHALQGELPEQRYLEALIADLGEQRDRVAGRSVEAVFFGGGTPSLLSPAAVARLIDAVAGSLNLSASAEITLEANPGTVDAGRFAGFRAAGVNRLSLGVQSFDDGMLHALGRIHDARGAHEAVVCAMNHFDNVNLDLMIGLPRQTVAEACADIETALRYNPPHLSCYTLTLEPNTPFHHRPPVLPDAETQEQLEAEVYRRLTVAHYDNYEISAWARNGMMARHNLNYWEFGDYLGIGAGAHAKLSGAWGVERQRRPRHPTAYMRAVEAGEAVEESWTVKLCDLPFEFMMNALRLRRGVDRRLYEQHTGQSSSVFAGLVRKLEDEGWLERDATRWVATSHGQRFLNDLLQRFLP